MFLEDNIAVHLHDLGLTNHFLDMTAKPKAMKETNT